MPDVTLPPTSSATSTHTNPTLAAIQGWQPAVPLPAPLAPLVDVAYNLHWSYSEQAWAAFARLDPALWESTGL